MTDLDVMENVAALNSPFTERQASKSSLQGKTGYSVIFYPKFHCELNSLRVFGVQPNKLCSCKNCVSLCVHSVTLAKVFASRQ